MATMLGDPFPARAAGAGLAIGNGEMERGVSKAFWAQPITRPGEIILMDFGSPHHQSYRTAFLPHKIFQKPTDHARLVYLDKWGYLGGELDTRSRATREILAPPGSRFAGHAAFTPDGQQLLVSVFHDTPQVSEIAVYDTDTWQVARSFSSHGLSPHDLTLAGPGQVAIVNGGRFKDDWMDKAKAVPPEYAHANISVIEYGTGQLVDQLRSERGDIFFAHFLDLGDGLYFASGLSNKLTEKASGPIGFFDLKNKEQKHFPDDPTIKSFGGEALSLAATPNGQVLFVTFKQSGQVVVVDIPGRRVRGALKVDQPRGVAIEGNTLLVSRHGDGMQYYDISTTPPTLRSGNKLACEGSHFSQVTLD